MRRISKIRLVFGLALAGSVAALGVPGTAVADTPQPHVVVGSPTIVKLSGGDRDAFLEPGEIVTISVPATNDGDIKATAVAVTLSSSDPEVTISTPTQSYKSIKVGATKAKKFKLFLSHDYQNDKPVQLVAEATFVGILSPTTAHFFLPTGEPSSTPIPISFNTGGIAIPDEDPAGVNIPFVVGGVGYASKMTFSFDGDTCTSDPGATTNGIDHTWVGDLVATLTSPAGDTVTLFSRPGGQLNSGNNICHAVFDDAASVPFASIAVAGAPFTGTWLPDAPLSASLLGSSVDGTWTLNVADLAFLDLGDVNAFTITFFGFLS